MRLLVTSGMGFISSNFMRAMLTTRADVDIVNLDRLSHGSNPANLQEIKQRGCYRFVKGDINDFELVRDLAKDREAVVNFAAETHVDGSIPNPRGFFEADVHSEANRRGIGFCQVFICYEVPWLICID